jgi:porphobilinogen synthase
MGFPETRLRRIRASEGLRRLVAETRLSPVDFIYPLFVCDGERVKRPIKSLDGCFHWSPDMLGPEVDEIAALGIPGVLLFGLPDKKDAQGSGAWDAAGPVARAISEIKKRQPGLVVITDVCLCEYTDHGHCGVVKDDKLDNDATLNLLARMALCHAKAGADMVAPSDMMDGRVGFIRKALDENGHTATAIMAYSAKYASAFYGPFREAAGSAPAFGDRKTYQMDPANADEAMREIELDIAEGADIVMVKPALPYLDVIRRAKERFDVPLAAYNVSGEYAMLKAAADKGLIDHDKAMMEMLTGIKRAGANIIITYFAKEASRLLRQA